jgi:hypothetical protein
MSGRAGLVGVVAARGVDGWGLTVSDPKYGSGFGRSVGWDFRPIRP